MYVYACVYVCVRFVCILNTCLYLYSKSVDIHNSFYFNVFFFVDRIYSQTHFLSTSLSLSIYIYNHCVERLQDLQRDCSGWLVVFFNSISTIVGYLISNPVHAYILNVYSL